VAGTYVIDGKVSTVGHLGGRARDLYLVTFARLSSCLLTVINSLAYRRRLFDVQYFQLLIDRSLLAK